MASTCCWVMSRSRQTKLRSSRSGEALWTRTFIPWTCGQRSSITIAGRVRGRYTCSTASLRARSSRVLWRAMTQSYSQPLRLSSLRPTRMAASASGGARRRSIPAARLSVVLSVTAPPRCRRCAGARDLLIDATRTYSSWGRTVRTARTFPSWYATCAWLLGRWPTCFQTLGSSSWGQASRGWP